MDATAGPETHRASVLIEESKRSDSSGPAPDAKLDMGLADAPLRPVGHFMDLKEAHSNTLSATTDTTTTSRVMASRPATGARPGSAASVIDGSDVRASTAASNSSVAEEHPSASKTGEDEDDDNGGDGQGEDEEREGSDGHEDLEADDKGNGGDRGDSQGASAC